MSIKHKIKIRKVTGIGVHGLATGDSLDLSDDPKGERRSPASDGERTGRSVPDNDNEYRSGGAYRAMLKLFAMHKNRTQIIFRFKCLIQRCREKGKWALAIRLRDRLYENYS